MHNEGNIGNKEKLKTEKKGKCTSTITLIWNSAAIYSSCPEYRHFVVQS